VKNSAMRDLIWTIIIIWVIYKVIDLFRGITVKKTFVYNKYESHNSSSQSEYKKPEGNVTVESNANQHKKTPNPNTIDGEYIDFEEIK
jgi:hypothetical protein